MNNIYRVQEGIKKIPNVYKKYKKYIKDTKKIPVLTTDFKVSKSIKLVQLKCIEPCAGHW